MTRKKTKLTKVDDSKKSTLKDESPYVTFERLKKEGHIDMAIRCMYDIILYTTERAAEELNAFAELITLENLKDASIGFLYELTRHIHYMAIRFNALTVGYIYKTMGEIIDHLAEEKGIKAKEEDINFEGDISKN